MKTCCVVVLADRGRARLVTVEDPDNPMFEGGPRLVEREDLINPEGQTPGKDLFANLKSGRGRGPRRGPAHGLDDHRAGHYDEIERRFARTIADATRRFLDKHPAPRVVLVAEPRLLGMIRVQLPELGAKLTELAEDLSWHALPHVRGVLASRGLLPEQHTPTTAYRPPGQPPAS